MRRTTIVLALLAATALSGAALAQMPAAPAAPAASPVRPRRVSSAAQPAYVEDDEDGYTKEDLEGYIEEYTDAQRREDEAMKVIRIFFPTHDWWELNTGDY